MAHIGWIGTGVMGVSMCSHLVAAGHDVTVTTRTRAKAQPLLDAGATWADTPAAVAVARDFVFSMVGYPDDVRAVMLGAGPDDGGVFAAAKPGTVVVDMTTSDPTLARELGERGAALGLHVLDAPVSGGDVGARNGTLSIMVGGPADTFAAVLPLFETMGSTIVHQGGHGAGQHTKLVNQTLVAGTMAGVCEALLYAQRAGLDVEQVLASVSSGAAGSWALSNLAPRIAAGDFAPGFFVDHFVKDMGLVLAEARRMQLALPNLALVQQLYVALQAQGHGRSGTQALVHALAALSGTTWD
ncbi:MAG: NAD(P)-dependent oxidoreductase [Acidimicrobiia bacterium]